MRSFLSFYNKKLNEAAEMLDISIVALEKVPKKVPELLNIPVVVTEKTDGVKTSIIRNDQPWNPDYKKNWIVSYKNNVIYPEDFAGVEDGEKIKQKSSGIGQYKVIFDTLKSNHENTKGIPPNTELFLEFIMRKGTLTREYQKYHGLILLASSPIEYQVKSGRVYSKPETFDTTKRIQYARMLGVAVPRVLFQGRLSELTDASDPQQATTELRDHFLGIESEFGGLMEGVVFEFMDGQIFKLLQSDQHDKEKRAAIKSKFEPENKDRYWEQVRKLAVQFVNQVGEGSLEARLEKLSKLVHSSKIPSLDPKRDEVNAKDDIYLTGKNIIIKKMPGNNGALFLGRFSPLTIAHYGIIERALKKFDTVTVAVVKAKVDKDNPFPVEVQLEMLRKAFGDRIELFPVQTGNLARIITKSKNNINTILAGTDRVEGYEAQIAHSPDLNVEEIPRTDGVSATLVRQALAADDEDKFQKYTPKQLWGMYGKLRSFIV